jgi:hypothetical protein
VLFSTYVDHVTCVCPSMHVPSCFIGNPHTETMLHSTQTFAGRKCRMLAPRFQTSACINTRESHRFQLSYVRAVKAIKTFRIKNNATTIFVLVPKNNRVLLEIKISSIIRDFRPNLTSTGSLKNQKLISWKCFKLLKCFKYDVATF